MKMICVAPYLVHDVWPHVRSFIERALIRGHSDYSLDYVYDKLKKAESLLWIAYEGTEILAAATTEINGIVGTDTRVCVITAHGGGQQWKEFLSDIEQYAREEKCELMRLYGRPGWIRALRDRGYEQPWVALEKRL